MYYAFLSLSILHEILCHAVSLLYLMSENDNFKSSCVTTAENYTLNERLKSCITGDATVIKFAGSLSKYVLGEIIDSNLVK